MTEPTNPLFDNEKEFLEHRKLEYERALRGDVEEIKEQTLHVGKIALVGAGVAGSVWLLVKAFSGRKAKKKHKSKSAKRRSSFEDYAGFDGFENDTHDEEPGTLAADYSSPEYADEHTDQFGEDDGFYTDNDDNPAYDQAGTQSAYATDEDDADDNGLSDYPNFPAHSSPQHGADADEYARGDADLASTGVYHTGENSGAEEGRAHSFASENSYQARPYDDSRRLPESNDFAELDTDEAAPTPPASKGLLKPALLAFAQSETGRVLIAQAAAVALALAGKVIKDILPGHAAETGKNDDLAVSMTDEGTLPAAWPATTAAQDVSAAAHHDDDLPYREPLA